MSRRCITSCAPKAATNNSSETITTLTYIGGGINPPMPDVINAIREALQMAFFMFWEVLWPLALGFLISAVVQSLVSREAVVRALGADDLRASPWRQCSAPQARAARMRRSRWPAGCFGKDRPSP